ncbi:hypothetical protein GKR41_00648 [Candidatus Vallotia lariciata]|nr:hypothetical protein GKR41_00648 [Candidatus Vallotia lariciata]
MVAIAQGELNINDNQTSLGVINVETYAYIDISNMSDGFCIDGYT